MELIRKYFPDLSQEQLQQFEALKPLYEDWNSKINVISRKDMDSFYEHHVLHSLGIARVADFKPADQVLDVGTGGGFPGIPLAIFYPEVSFRLVDSIAKKIKVVNEVAAALELKNVKANQQRAEQVSGQFDHVVSRAVTQLPRFMSWIKGKIRKAADPEQQPNGIWYLKGGDLSEELAGFTNYEVFELKDYFSEEFFDTKKVVYLPKRKGY